MRNQTLNSNNKEFTTDYFSYYFSKIKENIKQMQQIKVSYHSGLMKGRADSFIN